MNISSYRKAKEYLESFIKPTVFRKIELEQAAASNDTSGPLRQSDSEASEPRHDPLERMRVFLQLLGNPQEKFRSIQVSGTSGKGSTAYYISHILSTAGYAVGFSTSPHLIKINERIQISKNQKQRPSLEQISDEEFIGLLASMIRIIEAMKKMEVGEPSYFEITMAMGFLFFAQKKVDIAVVEVGIEGKYDASNTLSPIAAVLTNIDLDHTDILGSTVEEIAREAISIIKNEELRMKNFGLENQLVVSGVKQPSIVNIVEQKSREEHTELFRLGKDFEVKLKKETTEGSTFDFSRHSGGRRPIESARMTNLKLSMLGSYQIENAAIAIETVSQLKKHNFKISEDHIRKALKTSFFPGRFEIVHNYMLDANRYTLILDGAHNPAKMKAFITSLQKLYPNYKKVFIVAFRDNKDVLSMLSQITRAADTIIATQFSISAGYSGVQSMELEQIQKVLRNTLRNKKIETYSEKTVQKAIKKATEVRHSGVGRLRRPPQNDIIIITGSLYLVGEVKMLL